MPNRTLADSKKRRPFVALFITAGDAKRYECLELRHSCPSLVIRAGQELAVCRHSRRQDQRGLF
jgi:hypothetical protein